MLNAFRRHGRIHRRFRRWLHKNHTGAQRLSASWSDSPDITRLRCREGRVLNAFRRHGRIHRIGRRDCQARQSVLNAFRRHGRIHGRTGLCRQAGDTVLNAFRRHGRIHAAPPRASSPGRRAQRLSASWSDSQSIRLNKRDIRQACSTPFGVMVGFTVT